MTGADTKQQLQDSNNNCKEGNVAVVVPTSESLVTSPAVAAVAAASMEQQEQEQQPSVERQEGEAETTDRMIVDMDDDKPQCGIETLAISEESCSALVKPVVSLVASEVDAVKVLEVVEQKQVLSEGGEEEHKKVLGEDQHHQPLLAESQESEIVVGDVARSTTNPSKEEKESQSSLEPLKDSPMVHLPTFPSTTIPCIAIPSVEIRSSASMTKRCKELEKEAKIITANVVAVVQQQQQALAKMQNEKIVTNCDELARKVMRAASSSGPYMENEFPSRWKKAQWPSRRPDEIKIPMRDYDDDFAQSYLAKFCECISLQWLFMFEQQTHLLLPPPKDEPIQPEERKAAIEAILTPLTVAIPDVVATSDEEESSGNNSVKSQGQAAGDANQQEQGQAGDAARQQQQQEQSQGQQQDKADDGTLSTVPVERVCPMCWSTCSSSGPRSYFACPHCSSCLHVDCVVAWMEHQIHQKCPSCEVELMSDDMIAKHVKKQRREQQNVNAQLWDIDDLSVRDCGSRCGGEVVFHYNDDDPSVADEDLSVSVYSVDRR